MEWMQRKHSTKDYTKCSIAFAEPF